MAVVHVINIIKQTCDALGKLHVSAMCRAV
jgi:hypothetical protein